MSLFNEVYDYFGSAFRSAEASSLTPPDPVLSCTYCGDDLTGDCVGILAETLELLGIEEYPPAFCDNDCAANWIMSCADEIAAKLTVRAVAWAGEWTPLADLRIQEVR